MRILQLPTKVTLVKQLEFLPESFDGGANQVSGVQTSIVYTRKNKITHWILNSNIVIRG